MAQNTGSNPDPSHKRLTTTLSNRSPVWAAMTVADGAAAAGECDVQWLTTRRGGRRTGSKDGMRLLKREGEWGCSCEKVEKDREGDGIVQL